MEDKNILDVDYKVFKKLTIILGDKSIREEFLGVLPPDYVNDDLLMEMEIEGQKPDMSPSKYLLRYLGSRGIRVSHLVQLFDEIDLDKALVLLKKDEPLMIIRQPPSFVKLSEGSELQITIEATSYPPPEYQWFKGEEILLLQVEPTLIVPIAKLEDSGSYRCRVVKRNSKTGEELFSDHVEVQIFKKDVLHLPMPKADLLCSVVTKNNSLSKVSCFENNKVITIIDHPCVRGKIAQGMSICLHCKADSVWPVYFQWYRNGRRLIGETSSELKLNHLYPEPVTRDNKWQYQCEVYNEHDHVFSQAATVELDNPDEETKYIVEEKIAFMVANDAYHNLEELRKPSADVVDLAHMLSSVGFKIFAFRNLNLIEMENALHLFCKMLRPNVYALFYFAGHGFEECGQTYLLPVDCSKYLPSESLCTEYVLKCMQERNPEMNILLIDACRRLPPKHEKPSKKKFPPHKMYDAKMKGNTVYGYSTSYLYSSYESDFEANSFFAKHLMKYIRNNKKVQDIFMLVQQDLSTENLIRNLQFPMIKSTLSTPRKLCDPVQCSSNTTFSSTILCWSDVKKPHLKCKMECKDLGILITIEFYHHLNTFCNGIDVNMNIYLISNDSLNILHDVEVDIDFDSDFIKVKPVGSISLRNLNEESPILELKKMISDVQKVKEDNIRGRIIIKNNEKVNEYPFSNIVKISNYHLSEEDSCNLQRNID